jgi:hypothetical protein
MIYTIHPWVLYLDVQCPSCAISFMSKYLHQCCGPKPMTRFDINDNNQYSDNNMYKHGIPQFDRQKYAFWSRRMKTYIPTQGFEI